jgi:hypothetical protein
MPIDERTSIERLADASRELTSAQNTFQTFNHQLKQFDVEHSGSLTTEEATERESLLTLQQEALADLKEKEEIQKFAHHEVYAQAQSWGRSTGKWFRGDRKYEERG